MIADLFIFELLLIWSYFFIVIKKSFSTTTNVIFKIFISNISIITFVTTIIMGLVKFDLFFVVVSVSIIMISINYTYDYCKRRYEVYSKKYNLINKIKPLLDCLLILFISINIYY